MVDVVSSGVLPGMSGGVYGLDRLSGYSSWILRRYSRYMVLSGNGRAGGNTVGFDGCCAPLLDAAAARLVYAAAHTPLPVPQHPGDLLARLPSARVEAAHRPIAVRWRIDGEERAVLYQHPPSRMMFPLEVDGRGTFRAAVALDPAAWSLGGDGVHFEAKAVCRGGGEVDLLSVYVDPHGNPEQRRWLPVEAPLPGADRCPSLEGVALLTWVGKSGDRYFDWGGWAEPRIDGVTPRLEVLHGGPNQVLVNRGALPRARLVRRVVEVAPGDLEAVESIISAEDFDPLTMAVVEGNLPGPLGARTAMREAVREDVREDVRIVSESPQRVELAASTRFPALVLLSDAVYPGWRARVGDREVPILAANLLFRAVWVPAGRSSVVFEYRPASLRLGLAITLAGVVVGLAVAVLAGPRRRGVMA
jgi:hypothetical protein